MRVAVSDFRVVPAEAGWLRRRGLWSNQTANATAIAIANVNVKGEPLKSGSPCVIGQTCECDVRERVEVAESNGADGV